MFDIFRKAALAGIGALTLTEERAHRLINELVEQGRMSKEEGESLFKEMISKAETSRDEWEGRVRDMVQDAFRKMDLVPRKDLALLEEQVRLLEKRLAEMERRNRDAEEEVPLT